MLDAWIIEAIEREIARRTAETMRQEAVLYIDDDDRETEPEREEEIDFEV